MNGQMGQLGGQPVFILPEGTLRDQGKSAQKKNIAAAVQVAEAVRTTLGPKGMDKMLIDNLGEVVITNDGVTILEEMEIQHPAAKMIVEVAKTQDEEVGDGTTTAAVIVGELLNKAGELLDKHIHSTVITKGFRLAKEEAMKVLDEVSIDVDTTNKGILEKLAMTSMTGKSSEVAKEYLAKLALDAVLQVAEIKKNGVDVELDHIKIEKKQGIGTIDISLREISENVKEGYTTAPAPSTFFMTLGCVLEGCTAADYKPGTCCFYTRPAYPRSFLSKSSSEVSTSPPVALESESISDFRTLRTAKIPSLAR